MKKRRGLISKGDDQKMRGLSRRGSGKFGAIVSPAMVVVNRWRQPAPLAAAMYDGLGSVILPALELALILFVVGFAVGGLAIGANIPVISSDSGSTLATAKAAVSGNQQWIDLLAPPVQVALYAPFVAINRPEFAMAVPALFAGLLLILVWVAAWRITGIPWAGGIAGLLLLSTREYWMRAGELPAYQPFVFFGYLGLFLTGMALWSPRRSTALAIAGGIALALSAYSFNLGLAFLPAALLLALIPKRQWRAPILSVATAAILLVPVAAWHIAVAGVRNAWVYPHTILTTKYGDIIRVFWGWPEHGIVVYTTETVPNMLFDAAPAWLWALAAGGLLVIAKVHGPRLSAVIAASMVMPLLPLIAVQQIPHPRYIYAIVPAAALVSAVGLSLALRSVARSTALPHFSALAALAVTILVVFAASTAVTGHLDRVRALRPNPLYEEGRVVANKLDDGRVLLARSSEMQVLLPDNTIYTLNFFTENEYLAYLLWRDEELLRRALAKQDIGWILLRRPVEHWESDYNQWTVTATGYPPRHYLCLPQSEGFSKVYEGEHVILYKVDEAWLRGGASVSARPAADGRPESAQSGEVLGEQRAPRDGSKTDLATWRPFNSTWYVLDQARVPWGSPGDIPVPGDYNGDGKTYLAMWRPSNGTWYIPGQAAVEWGLLGDIPVSGDYDGDGKTGRAVWRPSNGTWYIPGQAPVQWGLLGDIPVPGDYAEEECPTQ